MCARIMAVSVFGSKEHYTKCLRTEPYVWVSRQRIEVNFKAAIISVFRATLLLMCLWGPTALGNSYWLLIVWQQPTLFQSPSHSSPVLRRAVVAVARLVMAWPPWVGILRTPAALPTLLILSHPPPLLQTHYHHYQNPPPTQNTLFRHTARQGQRSLSALPWRCRTGEM